MTTREAARKKATLLIDKHGKEEALKLAAREEISANLAGDAETADYWMLVSSYLLAM